MFVDLDRVPAAPPDDREGRHRLLDPGAFADDMRALGIGDDDTVIAYDDAGEAWTGRCTKRAGFASPGASGRSSRLGVRGPAGSWRSAGAATAHAVRETGQSRCMS